MFNLFIKKKSVDEIINDADLTPSWEWTPTQTPSILQAQNVIIDELMKEINALRPLKEENVKLLERIQELLEKYNGILTKGGLKYMEAKLQIVQNGYDKCSKQRDEYKHQLNAANKENEKLKKDIADYVFEKDDKINNLQKELNHMKAVAEGAISLCDLSDKTDYDLAINEIKKTQDRNKLVHGVETENVQKHPMYPIHWGGYDGAASAYPEEYKKWLYEQRDKTIAEKEVELDAEELLKRTTEFAESLAREPSWEQAASDLALKVVKLEEQTKIHKLLIDQLNNYILCQKQP